MDTNQPLAVASDSALPPPAIDPGASTVLRAPPEPGFFEVKQAGNILLRGAAQLADAREADFRDAASADGLTDAVTRLVEQNSEADFLAPLWLLALGLVMLGSWTWKQS